MDNFSAPQATQNPADLTASEALKWLHANELSAVELTQACLDRIAERDHVVRAWEYVDADGAIEAARYLDRLREDERGPLHGIPVGLKDIIDTVDMPTGYGSPIYAGHRPTVDAAGVERLRDAGAVILGKTVTTEFASWSASRTTNPHNPQHTPGGSSSGSAAAIGARMVPVTLGTQTVGSTIRPASFCGATALKATHGRLDLTGFRRTSSRLDSMGIFARETTDLARVWEVLAAPPGVRGTAPATDGELRIGSARTPWWEQADEDSRRAVSIATEILSAWAVDLPSGFEAIIDAHDVIVDADLSRWLLPEYKRTPEQLSAVMREKIALGIETSAKTYAEAVRTVDNLRTRIATLFERIDVLVVPAVTGEAPLGLESTGNPVFARPWSVLGNPAVTVPVSTGRNGLPVGVQLVAAYGRDGDAIRAAALIEKALRGSEPAPLGR